MSLALIADDDPDIREILSDRLTAMGLDVVSAADGAEAMRALRSDGCDIALLDLQMPAPTGLEILRMIREEGIGVLVIVITAYATIERAVEAMRAGAYDFIPKPFDPAHVAHVIEKALEHQRLGVQNRYLREKFLEETQGIVGKTPEISATLEAARKVASGPTTVLLTGESGTGKELVARAIHRMSDRRDRPFVTVNCAAIPENLLESELFGHEKGAFTGAQSRKLGLVEVAHTGTLFLDEIAEMKLSVQSKLLRVLEQKTFERVGGTRPITVDIRVITATNRRLRDEMLAGRFRDDLFYRLNVVEIHLPALRERREDIPILAEHFLERASWELKVARKRLSEGSLALMKRYDWPGNVRELANVVERCVVLCAGEEIGEEDLPEELRSRRASVAPGGEDAGDYHEAVEAFKRRLIRDAIEQEEGNQAKAARALGLTPPYLSRLMKKIGLR
ncbi:MAG: sigma-54 dependent transcriptional regulator [Planctomycetota bacterium]